MTSPATLASIIAAARTEKGLREENQDATTGFTSPFGSVYLLADGMGGQQGGAEASLMVAECYRKYLTSLSSALPLSEALQRATSATNSEVRLRSQSGDPKVAGMGSTVVMVVLTESAHGLRGTIAHVGDSRAYLLRQGQLRRLTRDHSAVQRLVDSQQITPEEARTHPDSSVITRALGQQNDVVIDISEEQFEPGDTILLCSDGLSGYVPDRTIAAELTQPREAGQTADALIALALRSGSSDNITVQVLQLNLPRLGGSLTTADSSRTAFSPAMPQPSYAESLPRQQPRWKLPLRYLGVGLLGLLLGILFTGLALGTRLQWTGWPTFVHIVPAVPPCPDKAVIPPPAEKKPEPAPDASKAPAAGKHGKTQAVPRQKPPAEPPTNANRPPTAASPSN